MVLTYDIKGKPQNKSDSGCDFSFDCEEIFEDIGELNKFLERDFERDFKEFEFRWNK